MTEEQLIELIDKGEDSKTQFKTNITNATQLAQEIVAFSNSKGGLIIIGVSDNGDINGLSAADIGRLNQLISGCATENVKPPVAPLVEIVRVGEKKVMVVEVKEGICKPYATNDGIFLIKVGADKRKISPEELQRLFQESNRMYADETIVHGTSMDDIDRIFFAEFYKKKYGEKIEEAGIPPEKLLENMNLVENGALTLAGLLLFGLKPQRRRPYFMVKAVSFLGNDLTGTEYRDSEDITGNLADMYKDGMGFLLRSLKKIQGSQGFNSLGELEVPKVVLEELYVNALVHRDYYIHAPINLFVFDNRIEIISPGKLPNNLTVENIKHGISVIRNPVLLSYAARILPYRGLGSGIVRALASFKEIEFENHTETERFKAIIHRVNNIL